MLINYKNREEWLKLKSEDISSTEVAALYGMSPYTTKFELFHIKKDKMVIEIEDNDRMKWGRRLEAEIAKGFAEDYGLIIRKKDEYMRHPEFARMSASFDYEIVGLIDEKRESLNKYQIAYLKYGNGLLEIKKVDSLIYRQQWLEDEAPAHIEFQVQQQMEVSGLKWCAIAPLVGGNELKDILRFQNPSMGKALFDAIKTFYANIEFNIPPNPDYEKDAEFIMQLYKRAGGDILAVTGAQKLIVDDLCAKYKEASVMQANGEDAKKVIKAQLIEMAKDASGILSENWKINLNETKEVPKTLVTQEMVGTSIGGRAGFRQCRITENNGK